MPTEPGWPPEPRGHCGKHQAVPMVQPIPEIIQGRAWIIRSGGTSGLVVPTTGGWGQQDPAGDTQEVAPGWHRGAAAVCAQNLGQLHGDARNQPWDGFGMGWPHWDLVAPRVGMAVPGLGLMSLARRECGEELFPFPAPGSAMQLAWLGCCV